MRTRSWVWPGILLSLIPLFGLGACSRTTPASSAPPAPSVLKGDIRVHDPSMIRQGNTYILRLPLPHVEMDKVLMTKKGDEMIIEIGNFKRDITLPAVLANQEATVAKFVNKALEIHFTVPEEEEQKSA